MLKVNITKLTFSVKEEENNVILLCIRLKENHRQSYVESRKLPIHILPILVDKFKKNDTAKNTRKNLFSPIIAIRKPDEDLRKR